MHDGSATNLPPASGATQSSAPAKPKQQESEGGIKETIESILIAFILAFIFRGFVVEAFVIPTGSMAPTLLGAHMRFTCPDCGYQFETNFDTGSDSDNISIPATGGRHEAYCPNCGFHLPAAEPKDPAYNPLVRYGDRILVLKYAFLWAEPKRWDVVVFKSPDAPQRFDYQQNYIKRLIGKPGESIMLLDGDVYAGEKDADPLSMTIQTKPRDVQDALWRIIHDSDYRSRGMPRNTRPFREPWVKRNGQTGWDLGASDDSSPAARRFEFDNATGSAEIFFNDDANINGVQRTSAFNDWLTYDTEAREPIPAGGWSLVGDLKIAFTYTRHSGDGPLRVLLSKRGQNFVAEIDRAAARLLTDNGDGEDLHEVIPKTAFNHKSGPMRVEFINVDYQVTLRINGVDVFQTTPQQYKPDIKQLLEAQFSLVSPPPQVRIIAGAQRATLEHVSLWRDIFYLSREMKRATPKNVVRLNADEFFTLGDNSQISGDGRYWSEPTFLPYEGLNVEAGKVPARFMLGRAFFVYWPAGYRPFESSSVPAIVPNFGEMRFIH